MHVLLRIATAIGALNRRIGRAVVWLILGAVLVSAATATLRYLLDWGSNSLIEIQWAMFGMVFLLGAAWTLQESGHVRIDLISARLPERARIAIDIAGELLFLLAVLAAGRLLDHHRLGGRSHGVYRTCTGCPNCG